MRRPRRTESGSVFFIILLAVAMFAMLTYAISQGSRGGAASLTREQARAAAQEVISYGNAIQTAVATLRLRGCTDEQLNFANDMSRSGNGSVYNYSNANSPTDESCHVFSPNGGKVTGKLLSSGYVDPASVNSSWMDARSFIVTPTRMDGAGLDSGAEGTDIVVWIGRLRPEVCMAVNDLLGVTNPSDEPPIDLFDCASDTFRGNFVNCPDALGDPPELQGKSAYCSGYNDSGPMYNYFQLLVAR